MTEVLHSIKRATEHDRSRLSTKRAKPRVMLISPRADFFGKNPGHVEFKKTCRGFQFFDFTWTGFTTGLIIVGAHTPAHWEIQYVDENIEPIDFDADVDIVALTGMTAQATRMYEIADRFRARGVPVVAGGLHANLIPGEVKDHVDAVCVGEAEALWPQVVHDFEHDGLQPYYRQTERVDLRVQPQPRYDLARDKYYPSIWIETSRGCPHRCRFCASTIRYRDKIGYKSIDKVIEEIEYARDRWDNPYILFGDDNFVVDRERTRELLQRLAPLGVKWSGQSDVSFGDDPEILELMHQSGCMVMLIGFESVSALTLTDIDERNWKLKTLGRYVDSAKRIQDHGIGVYGAFTMGFDTDNKETFDITAEFAKEQYLAGIQVSCVTPFPGTPLRSEYESTGRLLDKPWSYYTVFDAVFEPKNMTPAELEAGTLGVYEQYYTKDFSLKKTRHFKEIYKDMARAEMARDAASSSGASTGSEPAQ